jgi:hypothetical protein
MQTDETQVLYRDRWIECTSEALVIRGYYFPFGNKRAIAYCDIRGVYEFEMGPLTGKARIWGSSDFKYYFSLDPKRPRKKQALIVDIGGRVTPVITPDDTVLRRPVRSGGRDIVLQQPPKGDTARR